MSNNLSLNTEWLFGACGAALWRQRCLSVQTVNQAFNNFYLDLLPLKVSLETWRKLLKCLLVFPLVVLWVPLVGRLSAMHCCSGDKFQYGARSQDMRLMRRVNEQKNDWPSRASLRS